MKKIGSAIVLFLSAHLLFGQINYVQQYNGVVRSFDLTRPCPFFCLRSLLDLSR